MSEFSCPVVRVTIEPHPNADSIELARVGGYVSIVKKGQLQTGDLAVYLPEQSVVPEWLLKKLGFWNDFNGKGTLSGSKGNRIRAVRLRGVLSQGIIMTGTTRIVKDVEYLALSNQESTALLSEDEDASEFLGVIKYEPVIPVQLQGKVAGLDTGATYRYDFENLKKYTTPMFEEGETVVITEKLHGTFLQVGLIPQAIWEGKSWAEKSPLIDVLGNYRGSVTSKGLAKQGLLLDPTDAGNLYVGIVDRLELWERLLNCVSLLGADPNKPIFLMGEIFGGNVQDLNYRQAEPTFRAFDLRVGLNDDPEGFFVPFKEFLRLMDDSGIRLVPVLEVGPFSQELVNKHTDGNTTITATTRAVIQQIREGVVVKAADESINKRYGRKIGKSVSGDYLTRKNATEFN